MMCNSDYCKTASKDETITLKVSIIPVKHYKIIKYEEEKLSDYNYLISKIKSTTKSTGEFFTLHIKKGSVEIIIYSQTDWNDYYYNNIISSLIDNRGFLKIEFQITKSKVEFSEKELKEHNEKKLSIILKNNSSEWFMNRIISIFERSTTIQNELAKHLLKEIFNNNNANNIDRYSCDSKNNISLNNSSNSIDSNKMSYNILEKLKNVKRKLEICNEIERSIKEEDGGIWNEKSEMNQIDEEKGEFASFAKYYESQNRETFHEQLVRESMQVLDLNSNLDN